MNTKDALYAHCQQIIESKITDLRVVLTQLAEAKATETKSSAGDKFETGRSMLQSQEEQNGRQLVNALAQQTELLAIGRNMATDQVGPGSLVTTDKGNVYYVSIGLGRVKFEGKDYFCVSEAAPVAEAILGKKEGDTISFNGKKQTITKVE